jgi:hypothetical protein
MEDKNSAALIRYAFVAVFLPACLYELQLGVQVAGVFLAGLSLHGWFLGKVGLVDQNWNPTGYLTGASALAVSAAGVFVSIIFLFCPEWVLSALRAIKS